MRYVYRAEFDSQKPVFSTGDGRFEDLRPVVSWGVNLVKTAILFKLSNSIEQSGRIEQIYPWLEQVEVSACRRQRGLRK